LNRIYQENLLATEVTENTEEIISPPALSSKLERVPKNCTIVDRSVCITLSTRLWGERDGVRGGVLCG
jgi:hypothetical protein